MNSLNDELCEYTSMLVIENFDKKVYSNNKECDICIPNHNIQEELPYNCPCGCKKLSSGKFYCKIFGKD